MNNGYGYTKYSFKNITFVNDNSFYSADLKLSEGTQISDNNIYHYNWFSDYLLILKKICAISVFVSFPQSPVKSGILMPAGVFCGLYNQYNSGALRAMSTFTYYPLYDSSFSSIINAMSVMYSGQLNSDSITLKFESKSIYNYWYYNTITCPSVEMCLYI